MKVLVCGGRNFQDYDLLMNTLDALDPQPTLIIEGGAMGADRHARMWACNRGIEFNTYRADWEHYGRSAGHRRNADMLKYGQPELVVAFPGGRGTANMIEQAQKKGVNVMEITQ